MKSGIHQFLLDNPPGWLLFDIAFYLMPLVYFICYKRSLKIASIVAVIMFVVNFIYIQCYTLYPVNSIESYTPWLLFPFLLMTTRLRDFYFVLQALRYFFLFFFLSAGVWKFVQGGIFNGEQMSAILLYQHKEYLVSSPAEWYTSFIYWLSNNATLSFTLV
jgi:hypothetical protein